MIPKINMSTIKSNTDLRNKTKTVDLTHKIKTYFNHLQPTEFTERYEFSPSNYNKNKFLLKY